jgi:hypothetical protein
MDDEGPSVRRRTRGTRVERSERVERVYIEPEQVLEVVAVAHLDQFLVQVLLVLILHFLD